MTKHIRRRHFLVGSGIAFAQTALAGRPTRAASPAPPTSLAPPVSPPVPLAPHALHRKPGVAPGYIVSGRGEHSSNPYFRSQGGPSNKPMPRPQETHGKGINEDDQGENQHQGENQQ
jgi:hypothetical protein